MDDCCCDVESVDTLNKDKIYPTIASVVKHTFFKFIKVSCNTFDLVYVCMIVYMMCIVCLC